MSASVAPDVDLTQAGPLGNEILNQLDRVREHEGVHWSPASQCWLVTRHAELTRALRGELPLSCDRLVQVTFAGMSAEERNRYPNIMRYMPNWIIDLDPPDHTRLRKLLLVAFNRRVVESIRPYVRERVQTLMDKLEAQPTIEFNEQIARQLPGSVILKLLGLPPENIGRLRAWSNAFMEAVAVPGVSHRALQAFEDAMAEMNTILTAEIEKRKAVPQEDLLTELVRANEAGDRLSLDEMLGALHVLVVAGHDTTSNTMTMGLGTLIDHPEAWEYIHRNPDRILESVMELMRYMSMATSQPRFAMQDFEWAGQSIKKGQLVFLMLAAGNRDPLAFGDPLKLDLTRSNERSLTFAPGLHYCIGHMLAKMQVCEFFGELTQRFSGAELVDPKWDFMPQIAFRGLYQLNVRMQKRCA